jgi:hypothetical protein
MATKSAAIAVTPSQAKWIVERLISDRRISAADVRRLMGDLADEIATIELRLASLRDAAEPFRASSPESRRAGQTAKTKKRAGRQKKGHVRGIAGTLAVLLRVIPAAEHAAIAAIRADKGIKAAIKAAQAAVKKR